MTNSGIRFPEPVRTALRHRSLVVFAGAGVSMGKPARLPDFSTLADSIAADTGVERRTLETDDAFLGRLQHQGVQVHEIAARNLRTNRCGETPAPTDLHRDLLRLYPDPRAVRIVTTNFDLLFDAAAQDVFPETPELFNAPALPLGRSFNGVVHVHGCLDRPNGMVLTDADFGRAYLTEGWARRFLVELFRSFTVMFVGYSHDDTVMKYLARALPASDAERRFILTDDADSDRWPVLGITPVSYPREPDDDHGRLSEGVHGLANDARRGVLDWRHEITEIARRPPSLDDREADVIDEALADAAKAHFFAEAAADPDWLEWLEKRGHLAPLFDPGNLGERHTLLAGWMTDRFAFDRPEALFLLIARHGMRLNPQIWHALVQTLAFRDDPGPDEETLSRWVSFLLATAPPRGDMYPLLSLTQRCIRAGLDHSAVEIFDAMAQHGLCLSPPFLEFDHEFAGHPDLHQQQIELELSPEGDNSAFNELWESALKPRLEFIAEPLLTSVAAHLTARHRTFMAWQKADSDWDPESLGRDTIEPDKPGLRFGHVDVLIDAARDCLQWLACNCPESAASWCAQLASSQTPLLRRLCVQTLSIRKDIPPCEKFDWLFANIGLNDDGAAEELSQIMREIYPHADAQRRRQAIEAILAFRPTVDEDDHDEHRNAQYQLHWLRSLQDADPGCMLIGQAIEGFPIQHPEPTPASDDHPTQPWTVDRLLSGSPADFIDELLSFQQESLPGPDRHDLLSDIAKAAETNIQWGMELAAALAGRELWTADLWISMTRAWREAKLNEEQFSEVFGFLGETRLLKAQTTRVSDLLLAWLERSDTPLTDTLLAQANAIAARLWDLMDRDTPPAGCQSWHFAATGRPTGTLTRYWLKQRSILLEQPDAISQKFVDEVRDGLSTIAQDQTVAGKQGTAVLAGQVAFLLHAEDQWTRANLLPRFSQHPGTEDYWAVWDGYLTAGRLPPSFGPLLKDAFFDALPCILTRFDSGRRLDRFVDLYTATLAYFADDPVGKWIPAFFSHATDRARLRFASEIERHLRHMDDVPQREWWERWLKRYWTNRIEGVPKPLDDGEVRLMFGWLPSLKALFPTAVELALRMPSVPLSASRTIYDLERGEHWRESPEAVARLLIHLGKEVSPGSVWHGARELIAKLLSCDLPDDLRKQLLELAARLGLSVQ